MMLSNLCKLCYQTTEQSIFKLRISRFATKHSKASQEDDEEHSDYEDHGSDSLNHEELEKPLIKPKKPIVISCKRREFNFHQGDVYPKFQPIPLASRSWQHRKSKGDYFTIYPLVDGIEEHEIDESYSFKDLDLNEDLLTNLENQELLNPTAIQRLAIPRILERQNAIVTAETGSGKTYAFLIPMVEQILKWKPMKERGCNRPLGLILTPSHELTKQIARVAKNLVKNLNINVVTLVGEKTKYMIHNPPVTEVDIVVATIGVMSKLVGVGIYKTDEVKHLVIDEADVLFDETFCDYTRKFLRNIPISATKEKDNEYPKTAQVTLNSATVPQGLRDSLYKVAEENSFMTVTTGNEHTVRVPQKFFRLGGSQKAMSLLKLVKPKVKSKTPIIIFSNTTKTCDFTSLFLKQFGIKCLNLHGNQPIDYRRTKFMEFQNRVCSVLTTTDAGARGLDTCEAKNVINFDFPLLTSEYIHRCGRVGRIGSPQDCRVINFISRPLEIILTKKIEFAIRKGKSIPMVDMIHRDKDYEDEFIRSNDSTPTNDEDFDSDVVKDAVDKISLGTVDSKPYRTPQ